MRHSRKMGAIKLVLILVLSIVGGAIVNVAMAWGCAMWSMQSSEWESEPDSWPIPVPENWPQPTHIEGWGFCGFGIQQVEILVDPPEQLDRERIRNGAIGVFMAGWPCLALYSERHRLEVFGGLYLSFDFSRPETFDEGIAIPSDLADSHVVRCLPTRPLWPGFAINTIFYAAVLWLLFMIPGSVKRHRRRIHRGRGRCIHCGYDLRGQPADSKACPECGQTDGKRIRE